MEKTIGVNRWKWYQFNKNEIDQIKPIFENKRCGSNGWLDQVQKHSTNFLRIDVLDNGEKVVTGSLIYKQNFDEEHDYQIFHFYVSPDQLITVDLMLSSFKHI